MIFHRSPVAQPSPLLTLATTIKYFKRESIAMSSICLWPPAQSLDRLHILCPHVQFDWAWRNTLPPQSVVGSIWIPLLHLAKKTLTALRCGKSTTCIKLSGPRRVEPGTMWAKPVHFPAIFPPFPTSARLRFLDSRVLGFLIDRVISVFHCRPVFLRHPCSIRGQGFLSVSLI
jgi:hypothetical protein